jgi:DNA repair photolyase
MRRLSQAGVPVGVMFAPVIPWVNDAELEAVLEAAREAGADSAGYVLLRLPHEVSPLFRDWLQKHLPERAEHVMSTVQQLRGGKDYDARFGKRFSGEGVYADLLARRFALARQRLGFDRGKHQGLDCSQFIAPRRPSAQGELF